MRKTRWVMIFLCFVANATKYIDRANLVTAAPSVREELGIDAATTGVLLRGLFRTRIGSALSIPLISWLINSLGWRESFFVTGVLGFNRTIFWIWLYRDPEKYSSVTPEHLAGDGKNLMVFAVSL
jgi:sugar phosphate permease